MRIKLHTVGICGSDVHYYTHGAIGPFVVKEPMILGHEASGTVIEAGPEVRTLKVGDRVCMEPGIPDPDSRATRLGIYNVDPAVRFWATPPIHGILRPTVVHPELFTFKLPDNVSFAEAAMVEPLAVGVHGATKAAVKPGDIGVVIGAGPIGLVTALSLLAAGCARVFVSDVDEAKLALAATLGPITPVNVRSQNLAKTVLAATDGWGADVVVECSGNPRGAAGIFEPLCPGGRVVFIGGQSRAHRLRRRRRHGARGPRRARLPLRPRLPALHRHAVVGLHRREAADHPHLRLRRVASRPSSSPPRPRPAR